MNQSVDNKIESKISEDLSPTRNLTGLHLKIVGGYCNYLVIIPTLVRFPVSFYV